VGDARRPYGRAAQRPPHPLTATKPEAAPVRLSIVLPTYNERGNIEPLLEQLLPLGRRFSLEILVVDDDSADGTAELVRQLAHREPAIRLIRRVGRAGLASAIKEGLLDATGDLAVVMDSDGQHEPASVLRAVDTLLAQELDLVVGSRFHPEAQIRGLSSRRETGSTWANATARFSLPRAYAGLSDFMSGFFVLRLDGLLPLIRGVDVNGFKFLYELLAVSRGRLRTAEVPLTFQPRSYGSSKLDLAIFWDFLISILHSLSFRLLPRRAISFGLVGLSGVAVQLLVTQLLTSLGGLGFKQALPAAVIAAASSNYLINNALTFRFARLKGVLLLRGLLKFLLVASLPVMANVGLASAYYSLVAPNAVGAQLAGIVVVFVWNYAASSRFVWNTPN
jgi:dolichol-phosphate mannosyltransferase